MLQPEVRSCRINNNTGNNTTGSKRPLKKFQIKVYSSIYIICTVCVPSGVYVFYNDVLAEDDNTGGGFKFNFSFGKLTIEPVQHIFMNPKQIKCKAIYFHCKALQIRL